MGIGLDDFIFGTTYSDLPPEVRRMAERCLLDLAGTAAAGSTTDLSRVSRDHAFRQFGAGAGQRPARLMFDGREAGPLGAALAGGMTIDSFDAHDGHVLTKGHAGCAILPGLAAVVEAIDEAPVSGEEFLTRLVIGYEVALRAGIAQHAINLEYHTSGAWNSIGVAAVAARAMKLSPSLLREAIGIAEFHGPRGLMMRCIDAPTMVKDGSGWGAMAGLSAALLAADGFTGAPAPNVEGPAATGFWDDLGSRWRIMELYFKPYPVCRWAQPSIEAVLQIARAHAVTPAEVERIEIESFHGAVRLDQRQPATTEEAQYSLPFPVASALVHGTLLPVHVMGRWLSDPVVLELSRGMKLIEAPDLEARFPAERFARARIVTRDGRILESDELPARGDAERPLSDEEISDKFFAASTPVIGRERAQAIAAGIADLAGQADARPLLDLMSQPGEAMFEGAAAA
jgi:2-methylcitrate dehydratase PrpD